jgi:hypothetical protein
MYQMNHALLDDVAGDVGMFLAEVLPQLSDAWKKRNNKTGGK